MVVTVDDGIRSLPNTYVFLVKQQDLIVIHADRSVPDN